ncbi:MAG: dihydroorotate dehydrogenase electron transfer subunit [Candidatus Omnitrophica bacterium]|nr:dihydroorotate dehydrogenase electron transfer subunit [Candidatus Omnitrophota bacterium]MDD5660938.1 dihydroorotate dehydrogenase electron transfer subunit [Candidatus Omnitrophota bacterium]
METTRLQARIISNKRLTGNYWNLEFSSSQIARYARPGQFVNIRVNQGTDPLLRRPISIHAVKGSKIKLIYEVVGKGTLALSERKPQETLDLIGPLGKGFNYQLPVKPQPGQNIFIAGGMGVAPLVYLAEKLNKPLVLIGARTKKQILCADEFRSLGCTLQLATDDGSLGFTGKVTDLLENILTSTIDYRLSTIYACGPHPMLRAVSLIALKHNINAQVSLEGHMACGTGACLGCVVETISGYKRVCKDGPVFSSRELIW